MSIAEILIEYELIFDILLTLIFLDKLKLPFLFKTIHMNFRGFGFALSL